VVTELLTIGPQSLRDYPTVFKAGNKSDPGLPNFMEEMNVEHGEEYQETIVIEMQALQQAITWDLVQRGQVPRGYQCSTIDLGITN